MPQNSTQCGRKAEEITEGLGGAGTDGWGEPRGNLFGVPSSEWAMTGVGGDLSCGLSSSFRPQTCRGVGLSETLLLPTLDLCGLMFPELHG